jgi:hypothetical protein
VFDALDRGWGVDESASLYFSAFDHTLRGADGSRYLSFTGSSLGWATGAACGVALRLAWIHRVVGWGSVRGGI